MSLLPIVICLAALALVLGPVMLMQPTPAQRRESTLRNAASKEGLRVHFQPIPEGADFQTKQKQAIAYCLPWQDQADIRNVWILVRKKFSHELHVMGHWDWSVAPAGLSTLAQLDAQVAQLPEKVYAVASGPQGLCCYWSELGSEADVGAIAEWLKATAPRISVRG